MIKTKQVIIKGKRLAGLEANLGKANLVLVIAPHGIIACGYLNINTSARLGDAACIVSGVKTVKDLLNAKIKVLTPLAKKFGVRIGMPAKLALEKLL